MSSRYRLLIGLVLVAALAWGASPDLRATAKAAADATAKAAVTAATPTTANGPRTPAATPAAKADAKATPLIPAKPIMGASAPETTAAAPAAPPAAAQQNQPKNVVTDRRARNQAVQAAAKAARAGGLKPGVAGFGPLAPATPLPPAPNGVNQGPGGVPHYFGPYGNWAFSPLPRGPIGTLTIDAPGTGYVAGTSVPILDAYGTGTGALVSILSVDATTGAITGFSITNGGSDYSAPIVDLASVTPGSGAASTAYVAPVSGTGLKKFVDPLPGLWDPRTATPSNPSPPAKAIPLGVPDVVTYPGSDYYEIALREYSESFHSALPPTKLRGYVQVNNGTDTTHLYDAATNPTGCVLVPPVPTGARLCSPSVDNTILPAPIRYLGPVLVAHGRVAGLDSATPPNPAGAPKPVRIKFSNELPSGSGGDLFIPVDETVGGSGVGPALPATGPEKYTQNRATIHLHGNNTVWISDGNTHQWITPAAENTAYPAGVSARNVPDMDGCDAVPGTRLPGDPANRKSSGCQTFYYTNAQSARLQFYHDHAMGITRLNVYAGEAAGYVITDAVETDLITGSNATGVNPGGLKVLPDIGIPLVIQDKTFVDANTIFAQDPTWNWGTGPRDANGNITGAVTGDLWYPHVYMVVSNPYDVSGVNPFGKWFYGPWFNPPTPVCVNGQPVGCIDVGLVPNEYAGLPGEPPMRPGVPNPSIPGESFMDTPLVNGAAYPYVKVPAGPVRFRVLNASNDRGLNLQLYKAFDQSLFHFGTGAADPSTANTPCVAVATCTEMKMVPVSVNPANQFADTASGIPDPVQAGPPWIQIGTEGGFMPAPVEVPQQPIGFNMNTGQFNFSIVNQHSLYLQPAERADVIVDFSKFAGQTLILYNDSPAPIPAGAAVYDFYTGDGDQTGSGGAPSTLPGYGPNTRTIMQIQVDSSLPAGAPDYTLANLHAVWKKAGTKRGVFEVSQDPIIIPQAAYGSAYDNTTFPTDSSQYIINVGDFSKTFNPLVYDSATKAWSQDPTAVTIPLELKAMHDEMGGVYDTMFGRMSGMLGLTNPALPGMMPFPYSSPPTDVVKGSIEATKIGQLADGTQLWRIFQNGVDTHPIHVHLFTAQLINRVGQDSQVADGTLPVDPGDVGWKETFKVNPLEVTFLALRPTVPTVSQLPWEVPNSVRLIDPTLPEGATLPPPGPAGWFDPATNAIPEILNHYVNFGWEYVWHCHILSHEEMDFMHSLVFAVPPRAPDQLGATWNGNATNPRITVNWRDNALYELGFTVQRALDVNFTNGLVTLAQLPASAGAGATLTYVDATVARNSAYYYRVLANGEVAGDVSMANFPTMSADSVSNTAGPVRTYATATRPLAPTNLTATAQAGPQVSLTWRDNANNETGFYVQRCSFVAPATTCNTFALIATVGPRNNTGNVSYVDTTVAWGTSYLYRVAAFNGAGTSAYVTLGTAVVIPAIPAAATSFTVSVTKLSGNNYTASLNWAEAVDPASFTIERANNLNFTTGLATFTAAGTARTLTQTVSRNTVYYYRIRANNNLGGSSANTNASPFPIRTGN
jgi:FtsP/CotA-like multicopper oxidase with cupredoxin domain